MNSLRTRLLVGLIGGMMLLLIAFSLIIYTVIRRALVNQFDASLAATARILAAAVEYDDDEIEFELDVKMMPEFMSTDRPAYYQLWQHDGTVAARSPSLGTDDLPRFEGGLGVPVFQVLQTRNGRPGRAVGLKFKPRTDGPDDQQQPEELRTLTLAVARDASGLHGNLGSLRWLLAIASVGTITLSFLVAVFVVRQGLRPLNSLAAEIAAVRQDDLTTRIGTEQMPAEMLPVAKRLNDLLSRLQASFNRERRFTADVAHELRTPLAGIRSTLEVTLTRARKASEYQASLSDCLAISKNMQRMVENLLMVSRVDARQMTFHCERVQLADLVSSCWRHFSGKALERGITFENGVPAEMTCESDRECLGMVLANLFDNAVEYTNQAGRIWTTGSQTSDSVQITVANTGCPLTSEEISHVFDCFWRGDSSHTETGVRCGLGLALVQKIIKALGGHTTAQVQNTSIFAVQLTLPVSPLKKISKAGPA
jgi:two-component system heavy metal sensor histidine kinase CusS